MFKCLDDIVGVATDAVKVVAAPVEVAAAVTRTITKPAADVVTEVVEDVREGLKEI